MINLTKKFGSRQIAVAAAITIAATAFFGSTVWNPANAAPLSKAASKSRALDIPALTKIAQMWFAGMPIDSVKESRYPGLYEIQTPRGFFYMNATADWILAGDLIDVATRENVTQMRMRDAQKFEFSEIPLDNAFKIVKGDGSRKMVVFEDPNCGYCKKLESEFERVDNVTIYVQPWAMLSQDSEVKIKSIMCASGPSAAWHAYMRTGKIVESPDCAGTHKRIKAVQDLALKYKVQSTPTLFFANNVRISSALEAGAIEDKLAGK